MCVARCGDVSWDKFGCLEFPSLERFRAQTVCIAAHGDEAETGDRREAHEMALDWNDTICLHSSSRSSSGEPRPYPESKFVLCSFLIAVEVRVIVVCVPAFALLKGAYEHTRMRPLSIVIMLAGMLVAHIVSGMVSIVWQVELTCAAYFVAVFLIVPLGGGAMFSKMLIFLLLTKLMRTMHHARRDVASASPGAVATVEMRSWFVVCTLCTLARVDDKNVSARDHERLLMVLKFFLKPGGQLLIVAVLILPFLGVALATMSRDPAIVAGCTGCGINDNVVLAVLCATGAFVVGGTLALAWVVRRLPDRWGLGEEVRLMSYGALCAFVGFLLGCFVRLDTSTFDWSVILTIGFCWMLLVATLWQLKIGRDKQRALGAAQAWRKRPDSASGAPPQSTATSGVLTLADVVKDPELLKAFEAFLVSELGVESLYFLQDAEQWARAYYDTAPAMRNQRAKRIAHAYVLSSGSYGINLPSDVQSAVLRAVEGNAEVPPNVFDAAAGGLCLRRASC